VGIFILVVNVTGNTTGNWLGTMGRVGWNDE